jgi:hypothetical protein
MKKTFLILATIMLLSVNCNCQWYYKKYGLNGFNQMSQEELSRALRLNKILVVFDIGTLIAGASFTILGSNIIKRANEAELSVEGFFDSMNRPLGIILLSCGILFDISGIILLPINLTQISKINKVLRDTEIKVGLINCSQNYIINCSHIYPTPGISIAIHF